MVPGRSRQATRGWRRYVRSSALLRYLVAGLVALVSLVAGVVAVTHPSGAGDGFGLTTPVLIGVFGTVTSDGGDDIERLIEKIRRVETGADDVDFETDRDDEMGRLYDAVGSLAASAGAREQQVSEEYRTELYRIMSDTDLESEEKIQRLLELGCERLDVENGFVTRIDEESGRYEVETAAGGDFIKIGTVTDLGETFCRNTITSNEILGISDAREEDLEEDPAYAIWNIRCYIGGKIEVDDELYGTLCFVDREAHSGPFTHDEKAFIDLMTRWVSHELEQRKHTAELRLRDQALESAPVGVTITDPSRADNPITYANERFQEITGYPVEEVIGRNCRFLQGEGTADEPVAAMRTAIDAEEPVTIELRNYRRDGTEFWNRVSIAPVENEAGEVTNFVGFQEDVTERNEYERKLKRERDRFATLFDSLPNPAFRAVVEDGEPIIQTVNGAFEETFGVDDDEIRGERLHEFVGPPETEEELTDLNRRILDGDGIQTEIRRETVDGMRTFQLDVTVRERDDGTPEGYAIYTDITERKERERELRETKRRLELALEGTNTGIWEWNLETDDVAWNETLEQIVGLEPGEFEGTYEAFKRRVHQDDLPRVEEAVEQTVKNDELLQTEFRLHHEDGRWIWVGTRGRFARDERGERHLIGINNDISERKEREAELERYREYTDDVLEAVDDVFYVIDTEGNITRWNESLSAVTGYTDEEIKQMDVLDYFAEADEAAIEAAIEEVFETGEARVEADFVTKDGRSIPYEFVGSLLEDPDGNPVIAGVGRDISERKEYERELERTTDLLQRTQQMAKVGGWELDMRSDPPEPTWTEEMYRLHDLPLDSEIDLDTIFDTYHPGDRARVRQTMETTLENGTEYDIEARMHTESGETIWVRVMGDPIYEDGELVRYRGVIQDITEQREREQEIRATRDRMERFIETSPVGVLGTDTDGNVTLWNDEMEHIFGWTEAEVLGDPYPAVPADRDDGEESIRRRVLEGEPVRQVELERETKDGERIDISLSAGPVRDDEGEISEIVGFIQDITERKEREERLESQASLLDSLFEQVPINLYVKDEEARHLRTSTPYLREDHPDDEEWYRGKTDLEIYGEELASETYADDMRVIESGEPIIENVGFDPVEETWLLTSKVPWRDDSGDIRGLIGVTQDITEQKRREQEVRETNERLNAVIDASPDAIISLDTDGTVDIWNPAAEQMFGWSEAELLGEPLPIVPDEREHEHDEIERRLYEGETVRGVEVVRRTKDSDRIDVSLSAAPLRDSDGTIVGDIAVLEDITERKKRERELERTTDLLAQAQDVASIGGWELDLTTEPNELTFTDEMCDIHGLAPGTEITLEETIDLYHPDDRSTIRTSIENAIETGEGYDVELRFHTADGERLWVRAIGKAIREDGETVKVRGSLQDITEQKERELALQSLHDAARGLLQTESENEVAQLVVETATSLFDVPGVGIYTIDDAANRLVPIAYTDAFETLSGGAPSVAAGTDSVVWNCFATGERLVFDNDVDATHSQLFGGDVDSGLLVPIGDHGVFVAATDGPQIDDETRRLAETLVATTAAAFDRLESEADLRERDAELEAQNQRLRRQVQINDIIRRIDQSLIGATSREEVESSVCERLVESEDVAFAWIGAPDPSGNELAPSAWAGTGQSYLDSVSLDLTGEASEPSLVTANAGTPTVVPNVVDELKAEAWRQSAIANGYHSVVSVPLSVEEYSHGVLTVYADEPGVFGDLERTVFGELGESIANAIDALTAREALHADTVLELTLRFDGGDGFLARIAREADCTVEYEGIATRSADETKLFFATTGADVADVEAVLSDLYAVKSSRLISENEDRAVFEATVTGAVLPSTLVGRGASPRSIRASPTGTEAVVDVPTTTDVRGFIEELRDSYSSVELAGRRNVERGMGTRQQLVSSLFDELTDRQVEVLRTAYFAGFFEWPRQSTGEDVAEMLGVTQPTINRHLRLGQQRLLSQLFEEEGPTALGMEG